MLLRRAVSKLILLARLVAAEARQPERLGFSSLSGCSTLMRWRMLIFGRTGVAWAFSIFASAVALVCVKLLFGNPAASFHILIGADALICARLGEL